MGFQIFHPLKDSLTVVKVHHIPAGLPGSAVTHDKGNPAQGDQFIILLTEFIRPQQYAPGPVRIAFQQRLLQFLIAVSIHKPDLHIGDPEERPHPP